MPLRVPPEIVHVREIVQKDLPPLKCFCFGKQKRKRTEGRATQKMPAEVESMKGEVGVGESGASADENNNRAARSAGEEEEEEPEEGEIVGGDDSSASKPSTAIAHQPHPLEHSWTFWFDNPSAKSKQAAWGSSIRPVYTFATVEEFWGLYNNILHPSKLAVGTDFHCFKDKIEPKWEDPICSNGGKWTIIFPRGKADTCWLYTLLAMIGEQFDHGDEICGAVVNVRAKQEKIAVWTKNASNEAAQMSIGRQWKEFLDYNESIGFIFHDDAKKHDRFAKNRYNI